MENKITKDFSEDELIVIRDEVSKYMIEGDLVLIYFPIIIHFSGPFGVVFWFFRSLVFGFYRGGSMH